MFLGHAFLSRTYSARLPPHKRLHVVLDEKRVTTNCTLSGKSILWIVFVSGHLE